MERTFEDMLPTLNFEPSEADVVEELAVISIIPPVGPCGVLLLNGYTPNQQHIAVAVSAGDEAELIFEKAEIR